MLLNNRAFLIKKKNKGNILMANWVYEIFDPETDEQIGDVKEDWTGIYKVLGKLIRKKFLPRHLNIYDTKDGSKAFSFKIATFSSKVSIFDSEDNLIGRFDNKFLGGCFYFVYDATGTEIGQIKGNIMVKEFSLISPHEQEIGVITKSWQGACNEVVCKSASSFIVALEDPIAYQPDTIKMLLLAAGISLDMALTKK